MGNIFDEFEDVNKETSLDNKLNINNNRASSDLSEDGLDLLLIKKTKKQIKQEKKSLKLQNFLLYQKKVNVINIIDELQVNINERYKNNILNIHFSNLALLDMGLSDLYKKESRANKEAANQGQEDQTNTPFEDGVDRVIIETNNILDIVNRELDRLVYSKQQCDLLVRLINSCIEVFFKECIEFINYENATLSNDLVQFMNLLSKKSFDYNSLLATQLTSYGREIYINYYMPYRLVKRFSRYPKYKELTSCFYLKITNEINRLNPDLFKDKPFYPHELGLLLTSDPLIVALLVELDFRENYISNIYQEFAHGSNLRQIKSRFFNYNSLSSFYPLLNTYSNIDSSNKKDRHTLLLSAQRKLRLNYIWMFIYECTLGTGESVKINTVDYLSNLDLLLKKEYKDIQYFKKFEIDNIKKKQSIRKG